jgi:protoporphyrinogen oxidase
VSDRAVDILIIGGGPTGLGAAWRLAELARSGRAPADLSWHLVEAEARPGGLARSITDDSGFVWDFGGHVIYSHYTYFDRLYREILDGDVVDNPRRNWVYVQDRFVPFPIQHNFHLLDRDVARRIVDEARRASPALGQARNFREWLLGRYGSTLCDLFFLPYNLKMWGFPAERLGVEWTTRKSGSRFANVPEVDPTAMQARLESGDAAPGWEGATTFPYPSTGGSGAFWERLAARLPPSSLSFGTPVVRIDTRRREAHLAGGETIGWKRLISTMPLVELVKVAEPLRGADVLADTALLEHSSVHFVGLGMRGAAPPVLRDKFWIHCVPDALPFFRATVASNYAPGNVPAGAPHWSLLLEVTTTRHRPEQAPDIVDRCLSASAKSGWIDPADVVSRWHAFSRYGYPVPTTGRDAALERLGRLLESHGILSRGRFGAWKYEASNQDNTFMQGLEAVDRLVYGAEELTLTHPELLNEGVAGRLIPDLSDA